MSAHIVTFIGGIGEVLAKEVESMLGPTYNGEDQDENENFKLETSKYHVVSASPLQHTPL